MTAHPNRHRPVRLGAFFAVVCALCMTAVLAPTPARAADAIFAVSGRGWGHGVGMSQFGALGYAQQGRTYDWILAHYFQHTSLDTRPELTVKVDLDKGQTPRSSWQVASGSSSTTLTISDVSNGARSFEVTRGTTVWITFAGSGAVVRTDKAGALGSVVATFPGSVMAATGPLSSSLILMHGETGPFSHSDIRWRGQVRFSAHSSTTGHAVNYVPMEQYLRGVVPRESGSSWPAEALKAQAVAARSYAYDAASSGDVLWCTTMSQVYNGAKYGSTYNEAASTDAAIAATAGQYVVYGSKVITTYFSSSSGGRTANSKDVWFSSRDDNDTPVYYSSVEDADNVSGNPNYRWSLTDMTGTTLAGKIRSNYSSLAQPSPATVTAVTTEPGTSGFVRYVTLHWSRGADTVLTGYQFQHSLGLKTSAFSVTLKNPPPPPAPPMTRFQESDPRPLWTGSWTTLKSSSASGGAYRRASASGANVTVTFTGTSISWIGTKASHAGKADVYLDGVRKATVDLYDSSTHYKVGLWTATGLSADATHTMVIKTLGTHRSASGGSNVYVDAIDVAHDLVTTPRPPVWKLYQQNTAAAKYSSGWSTSSLAGMSGGTHAFSHVTSAAVTFTFTGTCVRWIGKRASNYGKAWVSVDGAAPALVDLYSAKTLNQQRLFESPGLTTGTHTLVVRVAGTRNTKSTYHYVDVDAFDVLQPAP
jgi:stage II sporulation protein D